MTQEQKRILIAEACGYEERGGGPEGIYYTHDDRDGEFLVDNLPDYFNDLNAMHEAEKMILKNADTGYVYDCELNIEVGAFEDGVVNYMKLWHATAAQRAEAFGRTLELWA